MVSSGTITNEAKLKTLNNGAHNNGNHLLNSSANLQNTKPNSISIVKELRQGSGLYNSNEGNTPSSDSISNDTASTSSMDREAETSHEPSSVSSTPSKPTIGQTQTSPSSSLLLSTTPSATTPTELAKPQDSSYAIIKVHAMYDTGLNKNVNIKLHITEQTTSRDIINLVIRHLNTIVQSKGKGVIVYSEESLANFCLVLKFQGHRKVLKDDYRLLQLRDQLQKAKVCITKLDTLFPEEELGQATVV